MATALYIGANIIMAVGSVYFAWRNRVFRKFLAGRPVAALRISGATPGPADSSQLAAASASAKELIAAIGFEP
jgi:hypothetical protein